MSEDRKALAEALDYFRARTDGPVILTGSKMKPHMAAIEAALRSVPAEAEMRERAAKVCEDRAQFARNNFPKNDLYCNAVVPFSEFLAAEIRSLPLDAEAGR